MTKPAPDRRPTIAAAVIVQKGRVLLVRRRQPEDDLIWAFPSGVIEPDESAEEAACRESYEEVGLVVTAVKNLGERIHPATGRHMVYIACEPISGIAHPADLNELDQVAWCRHDQLASYVPHGFFPAVQDYLDTQLAA